MNDLVKKLVKLISDEEKSNFDDEDSFEVFEDGIQSLAKEYNDTAIISASLEILRDQALKEYWYLSASIISWFVDDNAGLPCEWQHLTAILCFCLERFSFFGIEDISVADNLVWTIISTISGVGYASDWDPMSDSDVLKYYSAVKLEVGAI